MNVMNFNSNIYSLTHTVVSGLMNWGFIFLKNLRNSVVISKKLLKFQRCWCNYKGKLFKDKQGGKAFTFKGNVHVRPVVFTILNQLDQFLSSLSSLYVRPSLGHTVRSVTSKCEVLFCVIT